MKDGGIIIAKALKAQGTTHLFTLCGGHISPILVGAKQEGIAVIDTRQEPTAVFAADAYGRLTGIPGVAAVTAGPGVTNSITAIKNAQMAESPMILLGGAVATILRGRGALQDINQLDIMKPITKWTVRVEQDCDLVPVIEEAFVVARSGIPGPVFIELPIDLLYEEELVRKWYGFGPDAKKPSSIKGKIINWYLHRHVDKLFACASEPIELSPGETIQPFKIQDKDIKQSVKLINEAKKPMLVIGSQAMLRINNIELLVKAVEKIGIPTFLTGMARGLLGQDHPLYYRHRRSTAVKKADLLILAGMPLDFRMNYGRSINKAAKIININRDKSILTKNKKVNLGINADPSTYLIELAAKLVGNNELEEWTEFLENENNRRENEINKFATEDTNYINPIHLLRKVNEYLDENSTIIGDGGDFVATVAYTVKPRKPLCWLDPGVFGTLGVGAGFALSSKLLRPDSEVWLFYGDGAAGYGLIEFDTFVRHDVPVIGIIGNDAGWTQITRDQVEYLHDDIGTVLEYNEYHEFARVVGAKGLLLDNADDIDKILTEAKQYAKNGIPVLINAKIGKTDFRKGSISM